MLERIKQNMPKKDLEKMVSFVKLLFETDSIKTFDEGEIGTTPSWPERYMMESYLVAAGSSCYNVHSGSSIIYDKRVIGKGYNGAAPGVKSCREFGGCYKEKVTGKKFSETMNTGLCRGVHSEKNALFNMLTRPPQNRSATLYTTIFPCNTCAKDIIASRVIGDIVFANFYDLREFNQTIKQFNEVDIKLSYLNLSPQRIADIMLNHKNVQFDIFNESQIKDIKLISESFK